MSLEMGSINFLLDQHINLTKTSEMDFEKGFKRKRIEYLKSVETKLRCLKV